MLPLTTSTLIEYFGRRSSIFKQTLTFLMRELDSNKDADVKEAYRRWQISFYLTSRQLREGAGVHRAARQLSLGISASKMEQTLFCLHTYYVSVLKLTLARLLAGSNAEYLRQISVEPEPKRGLFRSAEFRYFDWPSLGGHTRWQRQIALMAHVMTDMAGDSETVTTDVFRGFYQNLIPPALRKTLGEFYTPEWVVKLMLDEMEYDGSGRLLDPTCGSGIFLFHALERVVRKHTEEPSWRALERATEMVFGFDLNPVAVATAKANYLLALKPCWSGLSDPQAVIEKLSLPIFLADSAVASRRTAEGSVAVVMTPTGPIEVFESQTHHSVNAGIVEKAMEHSQGPNGEEWKKPFKTFLAPVYAGRFDYVVGNPPWVAPDRVPEDYRRTLHELLLSSGFLEPYKPKFLGKVGEYPGAESQFVAALPILAASFARFLRPGGKLAFLLTSSLMKSLNAGGFRREVLSKKLIKIIDLSLFTKIHEGASCWAFIPIIQQKADMDQEPFEYQLFVPSETPPANQRSELYEAPNRRFHVVSWNTNKRSLLLEPEDPRSSWFTAPPEIASVYRTLITSGRRLGDFYRINRGIVSGIDWLYFFHRALPSDQSRLVRLSRKKANGISEMEVSAETDLVFPLIKGETCRAWKYEYVFAVIPHRQPRWEPIELETMQRDYPNAYAHFASHKKDLLNRRTRIIAQQMRSGSPFYVMEMKKEIGNGWKVAFRGIAPRLEASVVPPNVTLPLLGNRAPIIEHTVNFISVESEEKAHFLCALLNSTPLRTLLYDIAIPKGGRPMKRFDTWAIASLPAPEFDEREETCGRLASLSRQAHVSTEPNQILKFETDIDESVSHLFGLQPSQLDLLRRHYDVLSFVGK